MSRSETTNVTLLFPERSVGCSTLKGTFLLQGYNNITIQPSLKMPTPPNALQGFYISVQCTYTHTNLSNVFESQELVFPLQLGSQ